MVFFFTEATKKGQEMNTATVNRIVDGITALREERTNIQARLTAIDEEERGLIARLTGRTATAKRSTPSTNGTANTGQRGRKVDTEAELKAMRKAVGRKAFKLADVMEAVGLASAAASKRLRAWQEGNFIEALEERGSYRMIPASRAGQVEIETV